MLRTDAVPCMLARLDEGDVQVSVREPDGWHSANELLHEIVHDVSWQKIDLDAALRVAHALNSPRD